MIKKNVKTHDHIWWQDDVMILSYEISRQYINDLRL